MNNQVSQDRDHLRILSICHYVFAGLCAFPFFYGLIYMIAGVFFGAVLSSVPQKGNEPPAALFGGIFVIIGLVISGIALAFAIAAIMSGRNLSRLNNRVFSFIYACIICVFVPFGTALGVFTLIVLSRDSVKALFDGVSGGSAQQFGANPPNWR